LGIHSVDSLASAKVGFDWAISSYYSRRRVLLPLETHPSPPSQRKVSAGCRCKLEEEELQARRAATHQNQEL